MRQVTFNEAQSRYELKDGESVLGILEVQDSGDRVILPHTKISEKYEGQGLGNELVSSALDDLRAKGKKVVPSCPFVAHFIERHEQYDDMLADG